MTQADDSSPLGTSTPPSPTSSRHYTNPRRYRPFVLPSSSDLVAAQNDEQTRDDEHTPLLRSTLTGSHIRIADGSLILKPRLSRHHSSTSNFTPFFHLWDTFGLDFGADELLRHCPSPQPKQLIGPTPSPCSQL